MSPVADPSEPFVALPCADETDRVYCGIVALRFARSAGMGARQAGQVAVCVAELVSNVARHAGAGVVELRVRAVGTERAVEVVVRDEGPGFERVDLAVKDGYSRGRELAPDSPRAEGLGKGLGAVLRLMDAVHIDTRPGAGTTVTAVKYLR